MNFRTLAVASAALKPADISNFSRHPPLTTLQIRALFLLSSATLFLIPSQDLSQRESQESPSTCVTLDLTYRSQTFFPPSLPKNPKLDSLLQNSSYVLFSSLFSSTAEGRFELSSPAEKVNLTSTVSTGELLKEGVKQTRCLCATRDPGRVWASLAVGHTPCGGNVSIYVQAKKGSPTLMFKGKASKLMALSTDG